MSEFNAENADSIQVPVDGTSRDVYKIANSSGTAIQRKKFKFTYYPNGGTGTIYVQKVKYDLATTLHKNPFTYDGHTFDGWSDTPTGEVKYFDEQSFSSPNKNLDFYACWSLPQFTVTFDLNGGDGTAPSPITVEAGQTCGSSWPSNPSRSSDETYNYTFSCWQDSSGNIYTSDTIIDSNVTLYAQWTSEKINKYLFNFSGTFRPNNSFDYTALNLTTGNFYQPGSSVWSGGELIYNAYQDGSLIKGKTLNFSITINGIASTAGEHKIYLYLKHYNKVNDYTTTTIFNFEYETTDKSKTKTMSMPTNIGDLGFQIYIMYTCNSTYVSGVDPCVLALTIKEE